MSTEPNDESGANVDASVSVLWIIIPNLVLQKILPLLGKVWKQIIVNP